MIFLIPNESSIFLYNYDNILKKKFLEMGGEFYISTKKNVLWLPKTPLNIMALTLFLEHQNNEKYIEVLDSLNSIRQDFKDIYKTFNSPPIKKHNKLFYDHQNKGVDLIHKYKSFGLFWEQRCGKTWPAAYAVKNYSRVVVACPKKLLHVWEKAFKQFDPLRKVILYRSQKDIDKYNEDYPKVVIIGSIQSIFKKKIVKSDYIIVDESHFLRNTKSQQTKNAFLFRKNFDHAIVLSGTPSVSDPFDMLSQLKFLYNLKSQYPKWKFLQYFGNHVLDKSGFNKYKYEGIKEDKKEEWSFFICQFSQIVRRKDIAPYLRKPKEVGVVLDMTNTQRKILNDLNDSRYRVNGKLIRLSTGLTVEMYKQKCLLTPWLIDTSYEFLSPKIIYLIDYVNKHKDKSIIIWSESRVLIKVAEYIDREVLLLNGDTKNPKDIEHSFQNGTPKVLLANLQVGSQGFTFDRCDVMIFFELTYRADLYKQALSRLDPIVEKNVKDQTIIHLNMDHIASEHKRNVLIIKNDKTEINNKLHKINKKVKIV